MTDLDQEIALGGIIHGLIEDICNRVDDEDPGRVICCHIAAALIKQGWRHVGTEEARDS